MIIKATITAVKVTRTIRKAQKAAGAIRVKVERINAVRDRISASRGRMDDIRNHVERIRKEPVTEAWRQTAEGQIFAEQMQRAVADLALMINLIMRLTTVLNESATGFHDAQQAVVNRASDIKTMKR